MFANRIPVLHFLANISHQAIKCCVA